MKKYSVFVLLMVIMVTACKKNNSGSAKPSKSEETVMALLNMTTQKTYDEYDAVITLTASNQAPSSLNPDFEVLGTFRDLARGILIPINNFGVGSKSIPLNSANNLYQANILPSSSETDDYSRMFGTTSSFSGISPRLGNFTRNMYVPAIVQTDLSSNPDEFSKSNNVTVRWNADPANTEDVGILLWYQGNSILNSSENLPAGNITYVTTAPDNGQYTISNSDLANFPTGGYITVTVGRGSQQIFNIGSTRQGVITASTISVSEPKKVVL